MLGTNEVGNPEDPGGGRREEGGGRRDIKKEDWKKNLSSESGHHLV